MVGGTGAPHEPSDETREIVAKVKAAAEEKSGHKFELFEAVSVRTQLVAGINYFVKVKVAEDGTHAHLRIYKTLQGEITLHGIQHPKTADDALEYFEQSS